VKVQNALDAVDYYFIITFNCDSELVQGEQYNLVFNILRTFFEMK
jgi:hypothetical protein